MGVDTHRTLWFFGVFQPKRSHMQNSTQCRWTRKKCINDKATNRMQRATAAKQLPRNTVIAAGQAPQADKRKVTTGFKT